MTLGALAPAVSRRNLSKYLHEHWWSGWFSCLSFPVWILTCRDAKRFLGITQWGSTWLARTKPGVQSLEMQNRLNQIKTKKKKKRRIYKIVSFFFFNPLKILNFTLCVGGAGVNIWSNQDNWEPLAFPLLKQDLISLVSMVLHTSGLFFHKL